MHRFFVTTAIRERQPFVLVGEQAHQVRRVLRLRPGERLTLLDDTGWAYEGTLVAYERDTVRLAIGERTPATGEPAVRVTLYQAVLKGDHFGWVLQKGTEIGVSRFVPVVCERNVVDDLTAIEQKRERWERIIQEAAEQSARGRLPVLAPAQRFDQAVLPPCGAERRTSLPVLRLIPWEEAREVGLRDALANCNLKDVRYIEVFVGPEGGFARDEVQLAQRSGIQPVSLGPRILRAETAGMVAVAAILCQAGDMAPSKQEC